MAQLIEKTLKITGYIFGAHPRLRQLFEYLNQQICSNHKKICQAELKSYFNVYSLIRKCYEHFLLVAPNNSEEWEPFN